MSVTVTAMFSARRGHVTLSASRYNGCLYYRKLLFLSLSVKQEVVFIIKLLLEKLAKKKMPADGSSVAHWLLHFP